MVLNKNIKENDSKIGLTETQIIELATSVRNHPSLSSLSTTLSTLRTEVAQSATLQEVQTGVQVMTDSLSALESSVKTMSQNISDTSTASTRDMTQLRKNSDESLGVFTAMRKSLETLVNQAVNPTTPSSYKPTHNPTNTQINTEPTVPETKKLRDVQQRAKGTSFCK